MQRRLQYLLMVAATLLASCAKHPTAPRAALSSADALTAFSFLKSANPIPVDASGTISGTSIGVFLPPGTNRASLKASFVVSAGATVSVNGLAQTSGSTAADFTHPVVFVVTAQDGSKRDYTVALTTDIASVDNVIANFMGAYSIPALSLAITQDERLVYAKSYGKADVEAVQPATNNNLYRIASLSKQVTSIAIMRLMDQGRIRMSDTVFGSGAILGTDYGTAPYGPNITSITVGQLLKHVEGGWANDANDPMFTNPSLTAGQLISWTLDNRPLDHAPGTAYAYSNFGYCVLGRVIEKITGSSYRDAIDNLVLQPCGVTDMSIAGNTLADRVANEVKYYGQSGEDPYVYNVSRMDAHGGWLATATDLARILVRVDGFAGKPDILSSSAISTMTTPSAANPYYACGWAVNPANNWWHTGSLPGTGTEQARTVSSGRFNFVILTNTRSLSAGYFADMDNLFWSALPATPTWPSYDLF